MVEELNTAIRNQDRSKFSAAMQKDLSYDQRYSDDEVKRAGKAGANIFPSLKIYGPYISHSVIRKEQCGNKIARVLSVFFAEDGQYVVEYWFLKVRDDWALATFSLKGEGGTEKFIKQLGAYLQVKC